MRIESNDDIGAIDSLFSQVGSFCFKGEHYPFYLLWVESLTHFPLKLVEIEILVYLVLQLLTIWIDIFFFKKDWFHHNDFIKVNDLPLHEILMDLLDISLENWFFESCFYEIVIYSWWWLYNFENLMMAWLMILMRRDNICIETLDDLN